MRRIPTGKRTLYELVAEHVDGRKILVAYTTRKGFTDLYHALVMRIDCIGRVFGTSEFFRPDKPAEVVFNDVWRVYFSGKTQREAVRHELPFICDI